MMWYFVILAVLSLLSLAVSIDILYISIKYPKQKE